MGVSVSSKAFQIVPKARACGEGGSDFRVPGSCKVLQIATQTPRTARANPTKSALFLLRGFWAVQFCIPATTPNGHIWVVVKIMVPFLGPW